MPQHGRTLGVAPEGPAWLGEMSDPARQEASRIAGWDSAHLVPLLGPCKDPHWGHCLESSGKLHFPQVHWCKRSLNT